MSIKHIKLFEEFINSDFSDNYEFDIPTEEFLKKALDKMGYDSNNIKPLGEGMYGFASDIGNNMVVKVTNTESEAYYSNKLINIDSPNLVKTYDVKRIDNSYVIVMEKLTTNINPIFKHIIDYMNKMNPIINILNTKGEVDNQIVLDFFKDKLVGKNDSTILFAFNEWLKIYNECEKYGLPIDDLRSSNVGVSKRSNTDLVFFDISNLYSVGDYDMSSIGTIIL